MKTNWYEVSRIIVIDVYIECIRNNEVLYIHFCHNIWVRISGPIAIVTASQQKLDQNI